MIKRYLTILFTTLFTVTATAQVQSPEQFLGYPLGSRYSPHFKVVNYFRQLAQQAPSMLRLEQYGETNEGRPLLLAYISTPENLSRLEDVRQNSLRLAGMLPGKAVDDGSLPAVVWLSYNVHGNETSSSEAAMLTAWELLNPANSKTKEYLAHVVVIIDPCLNPDGRDRYVNWFNSVVGKSSNPQPFTREHSEPWPGGRINHYYFDLNRDWAWQTQVETQQRIIKFNQWLPQVHVDFHEQGYNSPYYFAPAAEPFHEVITPWQREFQVMIGKNNAHYFDQNGWLFFTKERFDLFYPSYGDTYPIYKGSIGMTFEQGGHSRGGAAVITTSGDTLTLWDRLYHHYTTGMSTIEVASQQARHLQEEFRKYYDKARTAPAGDFKAYLVKADEGDRAVRLQQLLDRNGIEWSYATPASFSGLNYFTAKTETVRGEARDMVINCNQPNSNLIKLLFERTSKISDSVTYDITAWSLPFAYGLTTYGLAAYVTSVTKTAPPARGPELPSTNPVAYAIKWNGVSSVRLMCALLKKGVRVRYTEQPFTSGQNVFDRGTLVVARTSNSGLGNEFGKVILEVARTEGVPVYPVESGFVDKGADLGSGRIHVIRNKRITLLAGDGISPMAMGEVWHLMDTQLKYPVNVVWIDDLNKNILRETDVLVMPDGDYRFLSDKSMNDALKEWVNGGGHLVALEGAVAQLSRNDWGIKMKGADEKKEEKKDEKRDDYSLLRKYENRERDFIAGNIPGSIYKVDLDNTHPLAFGYPDFYYTLKQDDNIYEFIKEGGWNVGVIKKEAQVAGFVGARLKEKLKDGLLFGVQDMGRGTVVYLSDNPMFRSFWENGKLMFCNAIFLVGN